MNSLKSLLISFSLVALLQVELVMADTTVTADRLTAAKDVRLLNTYNFKRSRSKNLQTKSTQAAVEKEEDGDPTGPDNEVSPTYLADRFEPVSPRHIRDDFDSVIPFSDEIFRDHTSLNTYYFYPAGYLLKYDHDDGFDINFLHRTRTDESAEELIVLSFTLEPRQLNGGMSLLRQLAHYAIQPANDKPVDLLRLPISEVNVNMSGLSSLIPADNVLIINSPQKVGDPIKVQATMTQSQKEDVVASIRDGGLSGDIVFKTYNNSFELVLPYYVSFTEFAGEWITDITQLDTSESIENHSPYPLLLSGLVVYAKSSTGETLKRYQIPITEPVVMESGAQAKADRSFSQLVASYGDVVAAWPTYERVSCDECLNAIERDILTSPAQASRTDLPIEAIPNIFSNFSLFKVLVEVKSGLFSPGSESVETKTFTLRQDVTNLSTTLYVNKDDSGDDAEFEYRVKPYHNDGLEIGFSDWKSSQGVMDITITAGDIRPLMPEESDDQDSE